MSNKPLKHSEQKKLKEKMERKKRETENTPQLPPRTIIFCEGTKTEPHYLQEIVSLIKEKHRKHSKQGHIKLEQIELIGTGRSCKSLLEYAVNNVHRDTAMVWLVYDKDNFPESDFDVTPKMAASRTEEDGTEYDTAWSNECFELWLLLHYIYFDSNISRQEYRKKLKESERLPGYKKSDKDVYAKTKHLIEVAFIKPIARIRLLHRWLHAQQCIS